MELNKTIMTIGLATALLQTPVAGGALNAGGNGCKHNKKNCNQNMKNCNQNPLLMASALPFGAPDFSRIKEADYLPAIEAAIKAQRANIKSEKVKK